MNQIDQWSFEPRTGGSLLPRAVRDELPITLQLRHGGRAAIRLRYELAGPEPGPLVLVAGGISAGRHVVASADFPERGWWDVQAESLAQHRILAIDWVGADGAVDLPIDPADQAQALILLLDHLGIARVAAYIGASYGAMVGMHFAAWHPRRLDALLAISAAGSSHPYASACRALQRRAVSFGEKAGDPASGVELARELAILTYRTPEEFAERFAERPSIVNGGLRVASEDYLDAHGERFGRCMSSTAYRRLSESIDLHAIDGVQLRLPVTLVAVAGDALVPADDCRALADSIPHARFHQLESRYGHDAFLKEERQIGRIITEFLNSLEQQS